MGQKRSSYRECEKQIGCDGELIRTGREMCGACERALARRNKTAKALKGQHYIDTREPGTE